MQQAISTTEVHDFVATDQHPSVKKTSKNVFSKFINWCEKQEYSRILWLVVALLVQIAAVLPFTLAAIIFMGNNSFPLWVLACVINVPVLIISLAAQPTKITIPVIVLAWTADVLLILYCAVLFYLHS
ncbi:hypothetical protein FC093_05710 [Ilyomonas limi]|uniref:Uncharacterized protein n=1 Tax=Ilyomonas limi TaxID=2575867 RepID=A0A4V5UUS5_9BACT|nr:hypothetical protein [Ilyomonas limi]TKK70243.1 hypothetical protein FC093_05710 [Ilyomonas limi]